MYEHLYVNMYWHEPSNYLGTQLWPIPMMVEDVRAAGELRMLWGDQDSVQWSSHRSETVIQMMMSIMINNMVNRWMMVINGY